jgi:hypothetical protein
MTTQVMMMIMIIMIGARRASYHQTKHRRGGGCTLLDGLLLLLVIVGRCEGAKLEEHQGYISCLGTPADCTSLILSYPNPQLTGTLPTQLGTLIAMTAL